jgi:hypothetical protein
LVSGHSEDERMRFLVLDTDLDNTTSQLGLIRKFELALRKALDKSEPARGFLKGAWQFIERVEAAGVRLGKTQTEQREDELLFDEFVYSLTATAERVCSPGAETLFAARFDGVLILIDEADSASKQLNLGTFCKLLSERMERRGCRKVMIGLAGLDSLRHVLAQSHSSAPRLFEEIRVDRLSDDEVSHVVDFCLERAQRDNGKPTTITDKARRRIIQCSEGYPHFVQQFGFSAFAADKDDIINEDDFAEGAFGKSGAMEQIGDRYYRDNFYNKIQQERYRQVLRIMADHLDSWVSKADIRGKFKGKTSTLDNALHALRERGIILSKEGERGVYRLQHKGFALWMKLYTGDRDLFQRLTPELDSTSP